MAIGILLGVGLYLVAALPVAVVVGRLLGGPPAEVALARAAGAPAMTLPVRGPVAPVRSPLAGGLVRADVAQRRTAALVALNPQAAGNLQLAGAEAHPAHA